MVQTAMSLKSPTQGLSNAQFVRCDLCGSDAYEVCHPNTIRRPLAVSDFSVYGEWREHPQIVRCRHCGLVYANPRDDGQALTSKYHALEPEDYLEERASREVTFGAIVRKLRRHVPAGRVLDVGCSAGLFLNVLPASYDRYGLEPSRDAAQIARSRWGDRVHCAPLHEAEFSAQCFDLVTMWDVIEHLESPRQALQILRRWTRPGGFLALITPDIGSVTARLLGDRWPQLIRQHLFYFTRDSLGRLLASSGYRVVHCSRTVRTFTLGYLLKRAACSDGSPENAGTTNGWLQYLRDIRLPVTLFDDLFIVATTQEKP